jgi:hypothetical protein
MENVTHRQQALTAVNAGAYLAQVIGLPHPISARRMWHYARAGLLPVVRLGRRVWFQVGALDTFAQNGGRAYAAPDSPSRSLPEKRSRQESALGSRSLRVLGRAD